jgi:hypothetical protein
MTEGCRAAPAAVQCRGSPARDDKCQRAGGIQRAAGTSCERPAGPRLDRRVSSSVGVFDRAWSAPDLSEIKTPVRCDCFTTVSRICPGCTAPRCPAAGNAITQPGWVQPSRDRAKTCGQRDQPGGHARRHRVSFGYFQLSSSQETAMGLIDTNSYARASAVPAKLPLNPMAGKIVTRQ